MTQVFVSRGQSIAILITDSITQALLRYCGEAARNETGGILIGHYTPLGDQAVITQVSGPPRDSESGRSWFVRGIHGLQLLINRAWGRHEYYLGEWHFHPYASPAPSDRDKRQILVFAREPGYRCPEPILIVVGGDPAAGGDLSVSVVLNGKVQPLYAWAPSAPKASPNDATPQTIALGATRAP